MKSKIVPNLSLLDGIGRIRRKPTRYRLLEQIMDIEFEKMGVKPYVYHFTDIPAFKAVTIVTIDNADSYAKVHTFILINYTNGREATLLLETFKELDVYGVAICNKRDQFNRQRGRIIAKGRLLKHLREEMEK